MAKDAHDLTAVVGGEIGDAEIADGTADGDDSEEFSLGKIRCAGGCEEHAGWSRKWNDSGRGERSGSPSLEEVEKFSDLVFLEFRVEVGGAGLAGEAKGKVGADDRSRRGAGGVFKPEIVAGGGEDSGEDVRAAEGRDGRAVEDGEEEQAGGAEMAEG